MKFLPHPILSEIVIIEPDVFRDDRGHFLESYQEQRYLEHGIPARFVQDNISYSKQGVLRGLHYQLGRPQAKIISCIHGEVFDVAVDIRRGSPSFGQWAGVTLSDSNCRQIYIPEGFAHGFCAESDMAMVLYKCTDFYVPEEERGIRWDDPSLDIDWPITKPILSPKDQAYSILQNVPLEDLPIFDESIALAKSRGLSRP
jgi:dTDP-4-dehydrorhamnose 3,5-epimerase